MPTATEARDSTGAAARATADGFLVVDAISKSYGTIQALASVSFSLERGQMLALLGPSGCGKSTLLNVVAGFLQADTGRIVLDGQDLSSMPAHKRGMPMVFQNYALFPHMTVGQNVAFGLRRRGVAKPQCRERVDEVLHLVKLPGYEDRYPAELSGGQQQRVALARCLVVRPPVLLLDEPLSNLDAQLRSDTRDEMNRILRAAQTTSIFVTHDQSEGLAIADRVIVLRNGQVEQSGLPEQVYEKPATSFAADFLGVANRWAGALQQTAQGLGVQTKLGWVPIYSPGEFTPGEEVVVATRPDCVQVTTRDQAQTAMPTATGVVTSASYLGRARRLRIECNEITVVADVASDQAGVEPGAAVAVTTNPGDCLLVQP